MIPVQTVMVSWGLEFVKAGTCDTGATDVWGPLHVTTGIQGLRVNGSRVWTYGRTRYTICQRDPGRASTRKQPKMILFSQYAGGSTQA